MTNEEKTKDSSGRCPTCGFTVGYIDKWGEKWTRISPTLVRRDRDGNLGGWFNGEGLRESGK